MPLKMFQEPKSRGEAEKETLSGISNVIAIAAGKGGVGKSTVTVNLALALQQLGYSVGVMDTDIYGPSVRKMLPEDRMPQQKGETIIPALCHGIPMISMAYFRKESEAAVVRAPIANGVITQFIRGVDWGELDILLIDFPPGTGDVQLTLSQQANLAGAIMVTTPQEVAVIDVRKAMDMFHQVNVPIIGVVENMSYYYHTSTKEILHLFGQGGGKRLAQEMSLPFLGEIPIDQALCKYGDMGKSIFDSHDPNCQHIAKVFIQLANELIIHLAAIEARVPPLLIRKLRKKDDHSFIIEWSDGSMADYRLSDLQKCCPCANCVDETTGKRMKKDEVVDPAVRCVRIDSVGRYALRIQFTSGCSSGIYDFEMLHKMKKTS